MSSRGYSLEKRGARSWRVTVSQGINPDTQKQVQYRETIRCASKTEAHRLAEKIRDRVQCLPGKVSSRLTVQEYLRDYLDSPQVQMLGEKTRYEYRRKMEIYVFPNIGQIRLVQLSTLAIQQLYDHLLTRGKSGEGPLAPSSVTLIHAVLNRALKRAVGLGYLLANPATATTRPTRRADPVRTALNADDVCKLEACIKHMTDRVLAAALSIGLHTGMRRGEIAGLQWGDIDFEGAGGLGIVKVRRTLKYRSGDNNAYGHPKTRGSTRTITMTAQLKGHLQAYKRQRESQLASRGEKLQCTSPLLVNRSGKVMQLDNLSWRAAKFFEENGFPQGFTLHGLRHTHASYIISSGVPIKVASERLGHSTITLTADIYGHLIEGADEAAALVFEESLKKAQRRNNG